MRKKVKTQLISAFGLALGLCLSWPFASAQALVTELGPHDYRDEFLTNFLRETVQATVRHSEAVNTEIVFLGTKEKRCSSVQVLISLHEEDQREVYASDEWAEFALEFVSHRAAVRRHQDLVQRGICPKDTYPRLGFSVVFLSSSEAQTSDSELPQVTSFRDGDAWIGELGERILKHTAPEPEQVSLATSRVDCERLFLSIYVGRQDPTFFRQDSVYLSSVRKLIEEGRRRVHEDFVDEGLCEATGSLQPMILQLLEGGS